MSLRLIIFYCTSSAPIPYSTRLKKKSVVKRRLRKYLSDKKFYGLKYQPFGLTLNPNSEVILRYSGIVGRINPFIYSRNFYLFLESNIPLAYQLMVRGVYMPLVIDKKGQENFLLFDSLEMHLIKIKAIKSIGDESGEFIEFYYSNLNPVMKFVESLGIDKFRNEYNTDKYLSRDFKFDDNCKIYKKLNETIMIRITINEAKSNYRKNKWRLRYALFKSRFAH